MLTKQLKNILNFDNSPWGNKPFKQNNNNFDDTIRNIKRRFDDFFNAPQNNKKPIIYLLLLIVSIWLASGFYIIDQGEESVVLRFGQFVRSGLPGPNYHLPTPFERMIKYKVEKIEREEIGYRSTASISPNFKRQQSQRNLPEESLMLTGDENIVDINFFVQWKVNNISDFVFNVKSVRETVKYAAESAMREIIGNTPAGAVWGEGKRSEIQTEAMKLLQNILNSYKAGVDIVSLQLLKIDPPAEVIDSFRDVQTARADKERQINQAQAYQNDILPRARGESAKILEEAEGYKQETIANAKGESSRFLSVYNQYKSAKDVTKQRMYIETMESILKDIDKIIIDTKKDFVPYLPLPQINKNISNTQK